ncbi:hypothetical protein [Thalassoglobus sp.]|uniref:hypothetical protein n=1 Tax=Thalassoglobus sp. TaxID=2795869 RepID=UPI003AA93A1A
MTKQVKFIIPLMVLLSMLTVQLTATGPALGADDDLNIKKIMKVAFKGDLVRKVGTNKATAQEKEELLKLVKAMQGMKPPKGDSESWTEKSKALVDAVQASVDGKEDAAMLLKKSTNCAACHKSHKPE